MTPMPVATIPSAPPKRRRRWLRWLGMFVLLIIAAGAGFGFYVWRVTGSVPDFYLRKLTGEQRLEALASVERKVVNFQDDLGQAVSESGPTTSASTTVPAGNRKPARLALTADELDTYFNKWLDDNGYRDSFERHLAGPRLAVVDGDLVLAGRMKSFRDAVVSLRFNPDVNKDGETQLAFEGAYAGSLSLPDAALDAFRERARDAIGESLPEREADVRNETEDMEDADNRITGDLMKLAIDRQLMQLLDLEPVQELVLFPPLLNHGPIPCRVVELNIVNGELVVGLIPLTKAELEELLDDLREPKQTDSGETVRR